MANPEGQQTPRRSRVKIVLTVGAVIAGVLALVVATSMWLTSGRSPLPTFKNESPKPGAASIRGGRGILAINPLLPARR